MTDGRCVMCGAEGRALYTYPNGGTEADREVERCLRCWEWFHAEDDGWRAAEDWAAAIGTAVEVTPADDPDWDGDRLEVEGDALPMTAVVPDLGGFAWVDAAGSDWLTVLRFRLADDLADGGHVDAAARLRSIA